MGEGGVQVSYPQPQRRCGGGRCRPRCAPQWHGKFAAAVQRFLEEEGVLRDFVKCMKPVDGSAWRPFATGAAPFLQCRKRSAFSATPGRQFRKTRDHLFLVDEGS